MEGVGGGNKTVSGLVSKAISPKNVYFGGWSEREDVGADYEEMKQFLVFDVGKHDQLEQRDVSLHGVLGETKLSVRSRWRQRPSVQAKILLDKARLGHVICFQRSAGWILSKIPSTPIPGGARRWLGMRKCTILSTRALIFIHS